MSVVGIGFTVRTGVGLLLIIRFDAARFEMYNCLSELLKLDISLCSAVTMFCCTCKEGVSDPESIIDKSFTFSVSSVLIFDIRELASVLRLSRNDNKVRFASTTDILIYFTLTNKITISQFLRLTYQVQSITQFN